MATNRSVQSQVRQRVDAKCSSKSPQESPTVQAVWRDQVLAESDQTIVVEGNHYFPADSVRQDYFRASDAHTTCHWKGFASY